MKLLNMTVAPLCGRCVILILSAFWPLFAATNPPGNHLTDSEAPGELWSLRPLSRPALPPVRSRKWARNEVDQFVLARLEADKLSPAPEASPITLIRRLYLTLTGLPPAPEDVRQFLGDQSADPYASLVEKLLDSPRYGECWARHWLDVARFAESNGFEMNQERSNAWPYRDYVIRAFNEDRPYDRFVSEQLAGDALGVDEATGFLAGGPFDTVKSPDINLTSQQRMDELNDIVSTTGTTFLGLTVGCARCHNHKFDPISQVDYYSMQAIFAGVQHGERPLRPKDYAERMRQADAEKRQVAGLEAQLSSFERPLAEEKGLSFAVNAKLNEEAFEPMEAKMVLFTVEETNDGTEPCLDELEIYSAGEHPRNIALAGSGNRLTASGTYPNSDIHRLEHLTDGKVGNSHSWISNEPGKGWVQIEFPEEVSINRILWGRDREEIYKDRLAVKYKIEAADHSGRRRLIASSDSRKPFAPTGKPKPNYSIVGLSSNEVTRLNSLLSEKKVREERIKQLTMFPAVYGGRFEQPGPSYRLQRGEALQKREQVMPAALHAIGAKLEMPSDTPEQRRRLNLANWITEPSNPIAARVLVNRLWQYHFGEGLARTPSDFGHMGAPPTHPELLDWLASELISSGWSIKHIQRLIVLSSVYRQSSQPNEEAMKADSNNLLLWRFAPRRLDAEAIRDTILAVSGNLDLRMGGRGFDLFEPNANYVKVYNPKKEFGPAEWRRMVYQAKPRMRLDDTFGSFDCPDAGQVTARRTASITPLQALNLLNSPFILQQSEIFAARLEKESGAETPAQVQRAFELIFNRLPASREEAAAVTLVRDHGLKAFCRALFNANEFLYIF